MPGPYQAPHPTLMLVHGYAAWLRARPQQAWPGCLESAILRVQRNYGAAAAETVRLGLTTALRLLAPKAR